MMINQKVEEILILGIKQLRDGLLKKIQERSLVMYLREIRQDNQE